MGGGGGDTQRARDVDKRTTCLACETDLGCGEWKEESDRQSHVIKLIHSFIPLSLSLSVPVSLMVFK